MNRNDHRFVYFMSAFALIGLLALSILSFQATRDMAEGYHRIQNADLSAGLKDSFYYDDKLYAVLGHGVEIDMEDPNKEETRNVFLKDSLQNIDTRIMSADVLYGMLLETALAYPLLERKKKGLLPVVASVLLIFLLLWGMNVLFSAIHRIPFYLPSGNTLICIAIGLLSVMAGTSVLLWILGRVRHKKIVSVLAVPVVFVLFIVSLLFEGGLYSPKYVESFDYLSEQLEISENAYYDEEKNAIIIEETAYPPQKTENPDYMSGPMRIPAYALEILNPYAGNSLEFLRQILGKDGLPLLLCLCYTLKSCGYLFLVQHSGQKKYN